VPGAAAHRLAFAPVELELAGRTALVTGASIGIGRGIALALAREGAKLAVVARRRALLEKLQSDCGKKLAILEFDFMHEDAPAKIAEAAKVKQLLLYHHDPTRSDAALDAIVKQVRKLRPDALAAREGHTIEL